MHLWFRLLAYAISLPFRARLSPPFETSRLRFRVCLTDLDTNGHMNNGRYLTIMDLGRLDLVVRSGLWRAVWKHRWMPVLSSASVRFRRELRLLEPFDLETRIRHWSDTKLVIEHKFRFVKGNRKGALAATCLVVAGLYDRKARAFVPISRQMGELGVVADSPEVTPDVLAVLDAETAIRDTDRTDRGYA